MGVIKIKPNPASAPLFAQLKQGTASAHRALEATYPFNTMMKPDQFGATAYAQNLSILASFHRYVAAYFTASASPLRALFPYLQSPAVTTALDADLQQLGVASQVPEFGTRLPAHSDAALISAAYVWMGSSMGARILHKWLHKAGYTTLPTAYYTQMQQVGQVWPDFVQQASELAQTQNVLPADCVHAANALFTGLQNTATALSQAAATESF